MPEVRARRVRPAPLPPPSGSIPPLPGVRLVPGGPFETARQDRPEAWRVSQFDGTPDRQGAAVSVPLVPAPVFRPAPPGDPGAGRLIRRRGSAGGGKNLRLRIVTWSSRWHPRTRANASTTG